MSKSFIATNTEVRNTQLFYDELDRLMGASIGVIAVRTREMSRGKLLMHQWASMRAMDFGVWDILNGFSTYRPLPVVEDEAGEQQITVEPADMAELLKPTGNLSGTQDIVQAFEYFKTRDNSRDNERNMFCGVMMSIKDVDLALDPLQQHIRDHVSRAYQCNDRIIMMLAPGTTIPEAIAADVEVIDLLPPSFAELLETFTEMESEIPESFNYSPDDADRAKIVQNGLGMTNQEFENALSLAIVDISAKIEANSKLPEDEREELEVNVDSFVAVIRGRKLALLKSTKTLSLLAEVDASAVGGLDLLKEELELQKMSYTDEAKAFGITEPKGFLVVGPPGTGKTLLCKVVSSIMGLPALQFDLSGVYGSLVGQSEQRVKASLQMVESMAPCILFIDELEKAVAGAGGGSSNDVSTRVFGALLTWMQEKKKSVMVIGSANNVEGIPPELLRKGRFDDIWALSFPSTGERKEIWRIHIEKRGHKLTDSEYTALAKQSDRYVGAEIEAIVEASLRLDFRDKHKQLQLGTLIKKTEATIPQSRAFPERIAAMKKWCEDNARPSSSVSSFDAEPTGLRLATPKRGNGISKKPLKLSGRSNRN